MVILFGLGLFLVALIWGLYRAAWGKCAWEEIDRAFVVVAAVLLVAILIAYPAGYFTSIIRYADFQAYGKITALYADTIEQTKAAVVKLDGKLTLVSLENRDHSSVVSARIREARDYEIKITKNRTFYKFCLDRWFLRLWIAKPPEGLL